MRIKEECLDWIINNPYTNRDIHLRFLESEMYPFIQRYYPDIFEDDIIIEEKVITTQVTPIKDIKDENI